MDVKGPRALFWVLVGIGCVLAVLSVGSIAIVAGGVGGAAAQEAPDTETEIDRLDDADDIEIDVFVHENESATFVVDYRFENDSDGTWDEFREDVEANPTTYADSETDRWNDELAEGENATEREMEIRNVDVETDTSSAPRDLGHVVVTFEWDSFAYRQLNRIEVEDTLAGFSLPHDTSFTVFAPEGYTIDEVEPTPESGDPTSDAEDGELASVQWGGNGDPFSSTSPTIVMTEERNDTGEPTEDEEETPPSMPWLIVLAALAFLATVGAAGWWIKRDGRTTSTTPSPNGGATATVENGSAGDDEPPAELLSNEERVLRLLEERGGRIKQQAVVSELDWTEAKTSQVVSGLREDDEVEVFRIGRENVLALPDESEDGADDEE